MASSSGPALAASAGIAQPDQPQPSKQKLKQIPPPLQPLQTPYTAVEPALNSNASAYALDTFPNNDNDNDEDEPLLSATSPSLEARRSPHRSHHPKKRSTRRELLIACGKMAGLFIVVTLLLGGILYLSLPTLDDDDVLKFPKSFDDLKALNTLLKRYRSRYPFRILISFICTYLYLQAFSLPGSMYMSILAGAMYGMFAAVPLICTCVATGATLCYMISAFLAPAILTLPKWSARLNAWRKKVESQKEHLFSFLIIIRIAPLPPHWVVNVISPHVGIKLGIFWLSAFCGIFGVTVIHTTIGGGLDEMTSADDFNLISWKNFFGLAAIAVAALLPVVLRRVFRTEEEAALEVERVEEVPPSTIVLLSDSEGSSDELVRSEEEEEAQRGPRVG